MIRTSPTRALIAAASAALVVFVVFSYLVGRQVAQAANTETAMRKMPTPVPAPSRNQQSAQLEAEYQQKLAQAQRTYQQQLTAERAKMQAQYQAQSSLQSAPQLTEANPPVQQIEPPVQPVATQDYNSIALAQRYQREAERKEFEKRFFDNLERDARQRQMMQEMRRHALGGGMLPPGTIHELRPDGRGGVVRVR